MADNTTHGPNFTCFHAGPVGDWSQFHLQPPDVPLPAKGKLFLGQLLGATGFEISLNLLPPGKGIPFLHRHRNNDEVYVVVAGKGQFLVDDACIDVAEGAVLRMTPAAARAWRNNSEAPFAFLCIQYRADSVIENGTRDGVRVEGKPAWPVT